jgi:hypothetical protein
VAQSSRLCAQGGDVGRRKSRPGGPALAFQEPGQAAILALLGLAWLTACRVMHITLQKKSSFRMHLGRNSYALPQSSVPLGSTTIRVIRLTTCFMPNEDDAATATPNSSTAPRIRCGANTL